MDNTPKPVSPCTVLVVYHSPGNPLSLEEARNSGNQYAFNTTEPIAPGDRLYLEDAESPVIVTHVLPATYSYVDTHTGELTNVVRSTRCRPIRSLVENEIPPESVSTFIRIPEGFLPA